MEFYSNRLDQTLLVELDNSITNVEDTFMYSGNVLTFLKGRKSNLFERFLANENNKNKIILMHPYSLFGRDRMAVEDLNISKFDRSIGKKTHSNFLCGATFDPHSPHWIQTTLVETIKILLYVYNFPINNIRLSVLNPLCSVLICDKKAFFTPYHYGKRGDQAECTAQNNPVIVTRKGEELYDLLLYHIIYLWERPTALPLTNCINNESINLAILPPSEIRYDNIDFADQDWGDYKIISEEIVKIYCPRPKIKRKRMVFFSHSGENIEQVRELKNIITKEFNTDGCVLLDENKAGEIIAPAIENSIRKCSHAIVFADQDKKNRCNYPKANVLHELGWCQATLGSEKVLILRFPGTELPSNIGGMIYTSYQGKVDDIKYVKKWLADQGFSHI